MTDKQLKEYNQILDTQYGLTQQLKKLKEERVVMLNQFKQNKNFEQLDKKLFELEVKAEMLFNQLQDCYNKAKALKGEIK